MKHRKGLTLIEVIIAIGLVVLLFGGIYASYVSIVDVVTNSGVRAEAAAIISNEIEIIRNLSYDQVGTVGGIPSGVVPQTKIVTSTNGLTFSIQTIIRNIDDPFDGIIGGTPNDTAPNDYKLVELSISCVSCPRSIPLIMTTTVAPKNLESGSSDGSLFINVLDASGLSVSTTTIQVVNDSTTPSINLTDITNASGVLQLIGAPTSSYRYAIVVSKNGYSSERTYLPGDPLNPDPLSQYTHATVAAQTVSSKTFFIDKLSTIRFKTMNVACQPRGNHSFSIRGQKMIGNGVYKFSSSSATDGNGEKIWDNLEWDIYNVTSTGSSYNLLGTIPDTPLNLNPGVLTDYIFILGSSTPNSLIVSVIDGASGIGIPSSTVTISRSGFSETKKTARGFLEDTDWSGNNYETQDGGIDTDTIPGTMRLINGPEGYSTTTTSWLISNAFDAGSTTVNYYGLNWTSVPGGIIRFQFASNNDNTTWSFEGPDGTAGSYYTTSGQVIPSNHQNHRYFKYKVFLETDDPGVTPVVQDVAVEFYGPCVPSNQVFFDGLSNDTYTLTASAAGYSVASSSISINSGINNISISL